ncbi:hypothetical protein B0I35DRAFT_420968 [Stachybotrys elegans]|uniref:Uncharacterized protein n=1 Tax=Stachybotrys elegans TaxID=80388 RepID=A0A8K0T389_9HYPO|nr:hypothetical protein B0I35DRAFT_420968 [Stachybotrys elegans]
MSRNRTADTRLVYDASPQVKPDDTPPEVYNPVLRPEQSLPWESVQHHHQSPFSNAAQASEFPTGIASTEAVDSGKKSKSKRSIGGCSVVVLVLSIVIAVLAAAVVGLAAGTGVAVSNYNDANSRLDALRSSYSSLEEVATARIVTPGTACESSSTTTVSSEKTPSSTSSNAVPSSTNFSEITNGCSDRAEDVEGTTYRVPAYNRPIFAMHCNRDASNGLLYAAFVPDFNRCMNACAAWNRYATSQPRCEGVAFVPAWTNFTAADQRSAQGNCYLKPGPQVAADLPRPRSGLEGHAAILVDE